MYIKGLLRSLLIIFAENSFVLVRVGTQGTPSVSEHKLFLSQGNNTLHITVYIFM